MSVSEALLWWAHRCLRRAQVHRGRGVREHRGSGWYCLCYTDCAKAAHKAVHAVCALRMHGPGRWMHPICDLAKELGAPEEIVEATVHLTTGVTPWWSPEPATDRVASGFTLEGAEERLRLAAKVIAWARGQHG